MREQYPFPQQPLIPRRKLDLGDRKRMSQMQAPIHVREGKVAEPFRVLFFDLGGGKTGCFGGAGGVDLEEMFVLPTLLVFFFEGC